MRAEYGVCFACIFFGTVVFSKFEVVLAKYSETVGLIYNISTGNPHEILKQILQSSLFGNILDLNILAFKEEDSKNDEWHQIK